MLTTTFSKLASVSHLNDAISSGACLVQHKGYDRKPKATCLMINVTDVPGYFIKDLAEACVKSVEAARPSEK